MKYFYGHKKNRPTCPKPAFVQVPRSSICWWDIGKRAPSSESHFPRWNLPMGEKCLQSRLPVEHFSTISEHFWIMKTVHVDSIVLWLCQTVEDAAQLFNNTVTQNAKQTQDWGQPDNLLDSVRARLSVAPEASVMKRNLHTGNLSLWTQHLSPDSFKVTEEGKGRPSYAKTHSRSSFVVLNGGGQFW